MRDLLYKEWRLSVNPVVWLWLMISVLLMVPDWPYFVVAAYVVFAFMIIGQMDKANQDLAFAVALPVPKRRIVLARTMTVLAFELAMLVVCVPFAVWRYHVYTTDNAAGMNVNLAFFGLMLVMYAVLNLVYLPGSYSRAYRLLWPVLGGATIAMVVGGTLTTLVAVVPWLSVRLNDRGLGNPGWQAAVFVAGLVVYAGLTVLAYRRAAANFEKVDL